MTQTRSSRRRGTLALLVALAVAPLAAAHGPLHEKILHLDARIAGEPGSAVLHLQRAELHRHHRDLPAALADYQRAEQLDPSLTAAELGRGRALFAAGRAREAREAFDRFLERAPGDAAGLLARARALGAEGRARAAADDYSAALEVLLRPRPEVYLERAEALRRLGLEARREVVAGIDEGIERLGPLVVLLLYAAEREREMGCTDRALARIDRIATASPRKEKWWWEKGEILRTAGRTAQAAQAYRAALEATETLSPSRRGTRAVQALRDNLLARLRELEEPP